MESLIGATFVQHGIDEARAMIHRLIDDTLEEVSHEGPALDWKTSLTVKAHQMGLEDPQYRMAVAGPEYEKIPSRPAPCCPIDEVLGTGSGTSKRKAQLAAAQDAWKTLDARGPGVPNVHERRAEFPPAKTRDSAVAIAREQEPKNTCSRQNMGIRAFSPPAAITMMATAPCRLHRHKRTYGRSAHSSAAPRTSDALCGTLQQREQVRGIMVSPTPLQAFSGVPRPSAPERKQAIVDGEKMTGAQALVRSLEDLGVKDVFGIPGGAILPVYDAINDDTSFRFVLTRHEQAAGMPPKAMPSRPGGSACASSPPAPAPPTSNGHRRRR